MEAVKVSYSGKITNIEVIYEPTESAELLVTPDESLIRFSYFTPEDKASWWSVEEVRAFAEALLELADQVEDK